MSSRKVDMLVYLTNGGSFIGSLSGRKCSMDASGARINFNQLERCYRSKYYTRSEWIELCQSCKDGSPIAQEVAEVINKWTEIEDKYGKSEFRN